MVNRENHSRSPPAISDQEWWPEQLDLSPLNQNAQAVDPIGREFDYAEEFVQLDLEAVSTDLEEVVTSSQHWWRPTYSPPMGRQFGRSKPPPPEVEPDRSGRSTLGGRESHERGRGGYRHPLPGVLALADVG